MKSRIFKIFIAMIMLVMSLGVINASADSVFLGDVDLNGKVNAIDARKVLRHAASLEILDDSVLVRADVNFDGKINSSDARLVLRVASQLDKFEMSDDLLVEQIELAEYNGIKANKLPYTLNGLTIESISFDTKYDTLSVVVRNNTGYAVDENSEFTYRVYDSTNVLINERTMVVKNMNNNEACLIEVGVHEDAAKVVFFKNTVKKCDFVPSYNMTTVDGVQVNAMPLNLNGIVINSVSFDHQSDKAVLNVSNKTGMPIASYSYISYKTYNSDGYIVSARSIYLEEMNNNENALINFYFDDTATKFVFYDSKTYKSENLYQGEMVDIGGISVNSLPYSSNGISIEKAEFNAKDNAVILTLANNNKFAVSDSTSIEYKVYNAENFVISSSSVLTTHLNSGEKCIKTVYLPEGATRIVFGVAKYRETDTLNGGTIVQNGSIATNALPYNTNGLSVESFSVDSDVMSVKIRNLTGKAISSSSWINYKCYNADGAVVKCASISMFTLNSNETQLSTIYLPAGTVKVVFLNSKVVEREAKRTFTLSSVGGILVNSAPLDFDGLTIESFRLDSTYGYLYAKTVNNTGKNLKDSTSLYYVCYDNEGNVVRDGSAYVDRLNMYYETEVRISVGTNVAKVVIYDAKIVPAE